MPWMSEMAFWVSPCPSAYSKSVTAGHLEASSLADAVVTSRQLLPPKPSVIPRTMSLSPHQDGTSPPPLALVDEPELVSEPPQAQRARPRAPAPTVARTLVARGVRFMDVVPFMKARVQEMWVVVRSSRSDHVAGAGRRPPPPDDRRRRTTDQSRL